MPNQAVLVEALSHRYGDRDALKGVSFEVAEGEVFGLLGPNGGGKTTLFRLLSTLMPIQSGRAEICGIDVTADPAGVRHRLGVTFQSPSLDPKLTVWENVRHQGHLYGLSGKTLKTRGEALLKSLGVLDRKKDVCQTLSGGLKRRVEIAKGLLHDPRVLLLDEPSTGLDPGARHDLWRYLRQLRTDHGVTVLVTTHLMEEAEHCDRLGILSQGELIALGTPDELREGISGDLVTIHTAQPDLLATQLREDYGIEVTRAGQMLRIEREAGHELVGELMSRHAGMVQQVTVGRPTLEDVFMQRTGHRFWEEDVRE